MENQTKGEHRSLPKILLASGVLTGTATAVTAFVEPAIAGAFGAATAIIAIWLTFIIARRQDAETEKLQGVANTTLQSLEQLSQLARGNAERASEQDYEVETPEPSTEAPADDRPGPQYEDEAIAALRAVNAPLDFGALEWRAKEPLYPIRGNHGWFVESPGSPSAGRWFVRKANGMTVRKAMPREFLDRLEQKAELDPRAIKLDFQLKEHGLAAWYARTYDGALWKVWRPNRDTSAGIKVEKVE